MRQSEPIGAGSPVTVTVRPVTSATRPISAGAVTHKLRAALDGFNDNDYLVLIGDPVAIGIATAVACSWNQGRAKLLKWDREKSEYFPVQIQIYDKGELDVGQ